MKSIFVLLITICTFTATLWSQSAANTGQIVGQILDQSGAAVGGAEVTVRNKDTNFSRSVATDTAGRYAASLLPLGPYTVTVTAAGLEATPQEAFVTLGGSISANFNLAVTGKSESVEVTADTPGVESTQTSPKSVLTDLQIHNLPFAGRRIQNLVVQTPTALIEPECSGFSINGQKGIYANVSIDGGDYDSTWSCGIRGRSSSSPTFGIEALQEVQVVRNGFAPEFGRSTGGVIQMSTRSGTNQFHGTAFEVARDGSMAARDALGHLPIGNIHQFGGSFGGPITRDRTFFFVAPEFQYGSKPVSTVYGLTPAQLASAAGQALLAAAPAETFGAKSNAQSVISRIDHRFSDANTFFGRFDFTRVYAVDSPGANALQTGMGLASTTTSARSNLLLQPDTNYTAFAQWTSALSSRHLNELRFQYSRELRPRPYQGTGPQVTVTNAAVYGPPSSGVWGNVGFESTDNRYQAVDNFSIVSGAHTTTIGGDFQRLAGHALYNQNFNGAYTFNTIDALLARNPSAYQQFTGTGSLDLAINELALYVQDEWRALPGLTISPGLRYEAQFNPNYFTATAPQYRFPLATSIPSDAKMFAPRLGLAWDIGNANRTVLRAGGGFFFAPTYMSLFGQSVLFNGGNPDKAFTIAINNTPANPNAIQNAFLNAGMNLTSAPLSNLPIFNPAQASQNLGTFTNMAPSYMDPNFRNPRALQWQTGIEQQITRGITISEDFSYVNTIWVARERDTNLGLPVVDATGRNIYSNPRPFGPAFGRATVTEAAGRSLYQGLTTTVKVRRPRYVMDLYYTRSWNYTMDDVERGFTGLAYADANNINSEYSYSNIDEPHQFRGTVNYSMPFGFDLGTTMKFTAGRPITARTGVDSNLDGNVTDRPIINGVMLKRNTFRNQGFKDVSLRLQKSFTLPGEKGRVAFSADAFNVFNFANLWMASAQTYGTATFMKVKDASGNYVPTDAVSNDSRTIQLGVRFQF